VTRQFSFRQETIEDIDCGPIFGSWSADIQVKFEWNPPDRDGNPLGYWEVVDWTLRTATQYAHDGAFYGIYREAALLRAAGGTIVHDFIFQAAEKYITARELTPA
jgi:hypothetical protein